MHHLRRHLIAVLLIPILLLAACSTSSDAPTAPVSEPAAAPETAVESVEEEMVPVAARPQLIEFYADW